MKSRLFAPLLEKLAALRPTKPLLVCETDGFTLRAALLARTKGEIQVLHAAQSRQGDMAKALTEVVATLEKQGWQAGGQALLLTPDVVTALLELPADPKKPKPLTQMEELVRWEMEPLLLQQGSVWSVGSILVGLGYLNEGQAREIIKEQQLRSRTPVQRLEHLDFNPNVLEAKNQFKRFGDLAVELGYITPAQLDDCLARQGHLKADDDEYLFGWAAQSAGERQDEQDTFAWLASGVSKRVLRQWVELFAAYGIRLDALYPLAGCAVAHLETLADGDVLLDANAGMVAAMKFHGSRMVMLNNRHSVMTGTLETCLEAWELLQPSEIGDFWLAASGADSDKLLESLEAVLDRKLKALPNLDNGKANGDAMTIGASMLGAALHTWRMTGHRFCCEVLTVGPQPPFWKRREVRLGAAGITAVLLILAAEVSLQVSQYLQETETGRLTAKLKQATQAAAKAQAEVDATKKVGEELASQTSKRDALQMQLDMVHVTLPERAALVHGLLEDLDRMTPDDVVLESIQETSGDGFRITAWALSDSAAQRYVKSFADTVRRWNQRVVDVTVDTQQGRLGLTGYSLHFRVFASPVPADGTPATPQDQQKNKGAV